MECSHTLRVDLHNGLTAQNRTEGARSEGIVLVNIVNKAVTLLAPDGAGNTKYLTSMHPPENVEEERTGSDSPLYLSNVTS